MRLVNYVPSRFRISDSHRENYGVIAIRATIIAIKKGSWLTIHNLSWPAIDYICGTRSSDHRTAALIRQEYFILSLPVPAWEL